MIRKWSGIAVLATVALIPSTALADTTESAEKTAAVEEKTETKSKKITDRKHPDYVRCRSEKVIGSLSKRRRICMTNREWAETNRKGNDLARELAQDNTSRPAGQ